MPLGHSPCSCTLLPGRKIAPLFGRQFIDHDIHGCQFETRHFLIDFLRHLMHPVIQFSLAARQVDGTQELICQAGDIPLALGGAARHNVANALSAAALTWCLGVSLENIRAGLTTMQQDENPGRCNIYDLNGFKVLVDFAHNPAAMSALFDMARAIPAERRALCFGQAGDRTDELIRELARDAWAIDLDRVIVSELSKYYRGREPGEVFAAAVLALIERR